jgi:hypothetical protein
MKILRLIRESILDNLFSGLEPFPGKDHRCQYNSFGWIDQEGNIIDLLKLGFKDHDAAAAVENKLYGTNYVKVNNALSYSLESGKLDSLNLAQIKSIVEIILGCKQFLNKFIENIFNAKIDFWYDGVDYELVQSGESYFDKITVLEFFDKVKEHNVDSIKEIEAIENYFYESLGI